MTRLELAALGAAFLLAAGGELPCLARTVGLAVRTGSPVAVFVGTLLGNLLIALPVLLWHEQLAHWAPPSWLRLLAGTAVLFSGIYLGLHILLEHD